MSLYWVLDVSGEEEAGEVQVWAIAEDGRRVLMRDRFNASFYARSVDLEGDAEAAKGIRGVKRAGIARRLLRGKPVDFLEVVVEGAKMEDVAKEVRKRCACVLETYEDDIRFSNQYILRRGVVPSSLLDLVAFEVGTADGYGLLELAEVRGRAEGRRLPNLRVLAFDALFYAERGSPDPARNPVVAIAVAASDGTECVFRGEEADVFLGFLGLVEKFDPDVLVGFNSNRRVIPYLVERGRRIGAPLSVGRLRSEPRQSVYGHQSVEGRIHVDLKDLAEETPEIKLETLEELTAFLGLRLRYDTVEEHELAERWAREPGAVLGYLAQRVRGMLEVYGLIDGYVFSLSELTGLPADHVLTAPMGFRVENYLLKLAAGRGEVAPSRREIVHVTYVGGVVRAPAPGLHEDVSVVDFKSMYPSLMIKYNVSFDTLGKEGPISVPGLPTRFSTEPGFLPQTLGQLLRERDEARRAMKELPEGSPERRVLEAKQRALKVIANAIYGYTGWAGARWYAKEVAEAVAALGRHTIESAMGKAKAMGLEIIYADTDSLFLKGAPEKIELFLREVAEEMGLEIKLEKTYKSVLFTEAKKKYAGLKNDETVEVVGLEAVRGDWSNAAKFAQTRVVEAILKGGVEEGVRAAREEVSRAMSRSIPLKDLVIWKQLTKPLEEYEAVTPHVVVAKKLIEEGWRVQPGDKVGYIVTKGTGRLYARVKPYFKVSAGEVDWDYYVDKQILPVCMRILGVFEVEESEVRRPSGLTAFL